MTRPRRRGIKQKTSTAVLRLLYPKRGAGGGRGERGEFWSVVDGFFKCTGAYIVRYLYTAYAIKLLSAIADYISGPSFVYTYHTYNRPATLIYPTTYVAIHDGALSIITQSYSSSINHISLSQKKTHLSFHHLIDTTSGKSVVAHNIAHLI